MTTSDSVSAATGVLSEPRSAEADPTAGSGVVAASGPSLRSRAIRGSLWTIGGYGASQALRLGSNLILTRLLFPEAFGLMALVSVVLQGLQMFSDVGLRGVIVHHRRGDDESFIRTAWTVQVIRGALIWICVAAIAWPVARFYEADELVGLLPVVGLTSLISGFDSTTKHTALRHLLQKRLVIIELVAQGCTIAGMISWALLHRSVWALVFGSIVGAFVRMGLTHAMLPGPRMRFTIDRAALASQMSFGVWILISTAMTFLIAQGDRVVLGKLLSTEQLGIYSIAFFLSQAVPLVVQRLSVNILFPIYARIREADGPTFRSHTYRIRLALLSAALPVLWLLGIFGTSVVRALYDERYADAGWMVRILAFGAVGTCVISSAERVMLAAGSSFRHMIFQTTQAGLIVAGMAAGTILGGIPGLLVGLVTARWLSYVPLALLVRKYGVWLPALDLAAFVASLGVMGLGYLLL